VEEGEHLRLSWEEVLSVMSSLARYELLATTPSLGDDRFFQSDIDSRRLQKTLKLSRYSAFSSKSQRQQRLLQESIEQARISEKSNAHKIVKYVDLKIIERVFNMSVAFTEEGIISFVTCLCEVAKIELLGVDASSINGGQESLPPRVFCLQKLVEVASYNMETRTRIVWSQLWRHLSNLFTEVGVQNNPSVAMYAIDSLKQLSMKFLEKTELSHFNFQSVFLIPFERIMSKSPTLEIKELILRVIDNITQAKVRNIMSGWRAIFSVYALAGSDEHESLNSLAFDAVDRIFIHHWDVAKESFVDLVNCLTVFAKNKFFQQTASQAIVRIQGAAEKLAEERLAERSREPDRLKLLFTDSKKDTATWWPILTGLANLTMDDRGQIRNRAMTALFAILSKQGLHFSSGLWELIFKGVLFPIFDDVQHSYERNQEKIGQFVENIDNKIPVVDTRIDAWLKSTCQDALNGVVSLFFKKESFTLLNFLLCDLMQLLENCIVHPNQVLARKGVSCLKNLLLEAGSHFDTDTWDMISKRMYEICKRSIPYQLKCDDIIVSENEGHSLPNEPGSIMSSLRFSPRQVLSMCYVQLDMIAVIENVIDKHWDNISSKNIMLWLKMLKEMFSFAKEFNDNILHRIRLLNAGFMRKINDSIKNVKNNQSQERPPSLLNQESQATFAYLVILFRLIGCGRGDVESFIDDIDVELEKVCSGFIQRYINCESQSIQDTESDIIENAERVRLGLVFGPLVVDILKIWESAAKETFEKHAYWLKPLLFNMIEGTNCDLRAQLKQVFMKQLL
jgi:brefeldin A-inhibited guanine nucleotide-exchange protein